MSDVVNHPAHYKFPNGAEVIDITENLGFLAGNVVKYVARAGRKSDDQLQDLQKARWYLDRLINNELKETTMSDQYTPTTEEVREAYAEDDVGVPRARFFPEFDRWLDSVKAEAWDEAVEALDRSHGDIYPIAVKSLDRRNPYREGETP